MEDVTQYGFLIAVSTAIAYLIYGTAIGRRMRATELSRFLTCNIKLVLYMALAIQVGMRAELSTEWLWFVIVAGIPFGVAAHLADTLPENKSAARSIHFTGED
jgi:hypothetical protein